jgi:hypothetical protein
MVVCKKRFDAVALVNVLFLPVDSRGLEGSLPCCWQAISLRATQKASMFKEPVLASSAISHICNSHTSVGKILPRQLCSRQSHSYLRQHVWGKVRLGKEVYGFLATHYPGAGLISSLKILGVGVKFYRNKDNVEQ